MAEPKWDGQRWRYRITIHGKTRSYSSRNPGRRGRSDVLDAAERESRLSSIETFGAAWERYLIEVDALTGPENYTNTESIGRIYLLPILGRERLPDLTLNDYQELIWKARKQNGDPLAKKTLSNIRGVLVNFSKFCVRAGLMTMTLSELKIPRNAEKKGKEILQPNEARRLMHDFEDEWYIYLWRWLLCTGMRPGEALGLKWSDIENNTVTIRRAINYRGRTTEGKNDNARRSFALNDILIGILQSQKERTWRLNSEYIFCNHAGRASVQTGASKSWYRISCEMGSKTSPYSLRHTFISFMAQALPEQALKSLVGHSVNMDTYGVYGHAVNGESQRTAEQVNITLVKKLQ